jgi:hypothetical protein
VVDSIDTGFVVEVDNRVDIVDRVEHMAEADMFYRAEVTGQDKKDKMDKVDTQGRVDKADMGHMV